MRVVIDYRAALRTRSGVGEYTHQLAHQLAAAPPVPSLELTLFSSSWKDRLQASPDLAGATKVDRQIPVQLLNLAWHRLEWPTIESLTGRPVDVVHALHPLLIPARGAAQVVTIHDLNFLMHPERTRAEIRRDYPALARAHAHRAHHIVVPSEFTADEVRSRLDVPADRISVCSPGVPEWSAMSRGRTPGGYVLFFGTLEPRKNVGALLDAWERLLAAGAMLPELRLAGQATEASAAWLARINAPPLAGRVRHLGYVSPDARQALYEEAQCLVQPSYEEGFGMPVLEAMSLGVPVVAANRGALPEVVQDAGLLVDPTGEGLAAGLTRMLGEPGLADRCAASGRERSRAYTWPSTARGVTRAYEAAIERRRCA